MINDTLNHLIDEVGRGTPVFHELYTPAQQRGDPTKASIGLVFFRGRPGAPFALIAPGGGFSYVGSVHEGFPYALKISPPGLARGSPASAAATCPGLRRW